MIPYGLNVFAATPVCSLPSYFVYRAFHIARHGHKWILSPCRGGSHKGEKTRYGEV